MNTEELKKNAFDDALITLASAAVTRDSMPIKKEIPSPTNGTTSPELADKLWSDIGIIQGTSCIVNCFYATDRTNEHTFISTNNLPDYSHSTKIELSSGTAYKFRIAAINSCGRGEWSDVAAFKTCVPGYPGAPCHIKITRTPDGVRLQWQPPVLCSGVITEYSVCLAIKNSNNTGTVSLKDLTFRRVYAGSQNQAFVDNNSLLAAHIDTSTKPAVIFRIAARNDKGYGPATQVRWLQDSLLPSKHSGDSKTDPDCKRKMPKLY